MKILIISLKIFTMAAIIPIITKLSSRVIRILGCNPSAMTLQGTNTYLLGSEKKRILIDTGNKNISEYIKHLKEVLNAEKCYLEHIIITHWHEDHIGGVKNILEFQNDCKLWKFPRKEVEENFYGFKVNYLKDKEEICLVGTTVRVYHTPGHTSDHIGLLLIEENALFSGDCILGDGTAVFEDYYDYMKSLNTILNMNPSIIYPGHGNVIQEPQKIIQHYIDHRNERENQIINVLKTNTEKSFTAMDLVEIIYTDTPRIYYRAAAKNVSHHLEKLLKENKVQQIKGKWRSY